MVVLFLLLAELAVSAVAPGLLLLLILPPVFLALPGARAIPVLPPLPLLVVLLVRLGVLRRSAALLGEALTLLLLGEALLGVLRRSATLLGEERESLGGSLAFSWSAFAMEEGLVR